MNIRIIVAIAVISLIAACKNEDGNMVADSAVAADATEGAQSVMMSPMPLKSSNQPVEQKIIRQAELRFKTDDLESTYKRIYEAAKKYGAVVQNDVEGKSDEQAFRNITVRIPGTSFDPFISAVSHGVAYFDRKEISAEDVTAQFIDLEARLKAKKALEARYLELLKKAGKISDMLEIEKELSAIREEIESQEGQLRYIQNRVSLSTVNIEIYKPAAYGGSVTVSYGQKMWTAIKSGFNGISAFFLGVLYIWPFILILAILFFILRRKFKKNTITP